MNRSSSLAVLALIVAPGAGFAQFGGMGGMGGGGMGGMGGGPGSVGIRRAVQVEMEGGRRLSGQVSLANLTVSSDLGLHTIRPDQIKTIRFLKPMNEPRADEAEAENLPPAPVAPRAMPPGAMMGMVNQNNVMGQRPTVRAKVILKSGEEIIGNLQYGISFQLAVDYGSMTPSLDKLRTMTFGEIERKAGPGGGSARPAGDDAGTGAALPTSFRYHRALVIRSPSGDRVSLYNMETRQVLELSGPEDGPLGVTPIYSADLLALGLSGPKVRRIAVADTAGGWHVQDLRRPVDGPVMPVVAQGVAVYTEGRYAYAYGVEAGRWDVAELPEDFHARPVVGPNQVSIEGRGHIYTFAARAGRWDHVDLRAILDGAGAGRK